MTRILSPVLAGLLLAACASPMTPDVRPIYLPAPVHLAIGASSSPSPPALLPRASYVAPLPAPVLPSPIASPTPAGGRYASLVNDKTRLRVAVASYPGNVPLDTSALPPWQGPLLPRVSANGRYMVYDASEGLAQKLVVWDLEQQAPLALPGLTDDDPREADIDGSGRTLVLLAGVPWQPDLVLYDVTTGTTRRLDLPRDLVANARSPSISADGRRVAYMITSRLGDNDIVVLDVASGVPITPPALNGPGQERDPAPSPDGNTLVFASDRNGSLDLFACDLVSGAMRPLSCCNTLGDESQPRFVGPGGDWLAYLASRNGVQQVLVQPWR